MSLADDLRQKRCRSCESGVPALSAQEVRKLLAGVPTWENVEDGRRIRRQWSMEDFVSGIAFFDEVAKLAEEEGHHPDLHLVSYRQVIIELWTHAVNGLTENDFIMAAKIDKLAANLVS